MRKIKYRAWVNDGEYSHMVESDQAVMTALKNTYNDSGVAEGTTGYHYVDTMPKTQKYELMQYTGLQDKNGVEIFEGDILEVDHDDGFLILSGLSKVEFYYGSFLAIDKSDCRYELRGIEELNVVGNIYENPELIKACD